MATELKEFSLAGKAAIVVGNNSFTEAAALALAEAGADIALVTPDNSLADRVKTGVAGFGRKLVTFIDDAGSEARVNEITDKVVREFSHLEILVNSTSEKKTRPFVELSLEDLQGALSAHITPAFLFSRAAGRHFLKRGKGRMINIGSGLAVRGMAERVADCTSLGGLYQLTRALGLEWVKSGIRVNYIGHGWFEGDTQTQTLINYIPARRLGQPWEIGGLVIFLASDSADYVTAQAFFVDGGLMARA